MDIGRITEADVKRAVGRVLAGTGLEDSPLLAMSAVAERLRASDVTPTAEARVWALGEIFDQVARASLVRLRGPSAVGGDPPCDRTQVATALRADFCAGSADLEAWSCLYHRFLSPYPQRVQELASIVMPGAVHGRRLISRRLVRGYGLLADALREIERQANRRAAPDAGEAVPGGVAAAAPVTARAALPGRSLPRWRTSFLGREDDVSGVVAALQPGALVTLVGPPGAGKTRLAGEVARALGGECPGGVVFVELAPVTEADQLSHPVAAAADVPEVPGRTVEDALAAALAGRRALLVLDNCEHLLASCAELADRLLGACDDLRLLATSRERLNVEGERVWRVAGLAVPSPHHGATAEAVGSTAAAALFVDRATASDQRFRLTDANAGAVTAICRQLDGLPLALELAAARVGSLSVEALAERLADGVGLLAAGQRKPGRRAEPIHETVMWSYRLLDPAHQALFVRLGCFAAGWTSDAAEAVCAGGQVPPGSVTTSLADLADRSLVVTALEGERVRYRFVAAVREVAREMFASSPDTTRVRDRMLDWYVDLAERAEPALKGDAQGDWIARLSATHENLRAALYWARAKPDPARGLQMAGALAHYWQMRGTLTEGRAHLAALLQAAGGVDPAVRSRALDGAGMLARAQGDYAAARAYLAEVLVIRRAQGDDAGVAETLRRLGAVADEQGEYDKALDMFRRSLDRYRAIGERWGTAAALNSLGLALYHQGRYDEARAHLQESLALFRAIGEAWATGVTLLNLGNVAFDRGDLADARAFYEDGLGVARDLEDQVGVAEALAGLGHVALAEGTAPEARRLYLQSGRILLDVDDRRELAEVLEFLAAVDEAEGERVRAVRLLAAADGLRVRIGAPLPDKDTAERAARLAALETSLGKRSFDAAWATGRQVSWREVAGEVFRAGA